MTTWLKIDWSWPFIILGHDPNTDVQTYTLSFVFIIAIRLSVTAITKTHFLLTVANSTVSKIDADTISTTDGNIPRVLMYLPRSVSDMGKHRTTNS